MNFIEVLLIRRIAEVKAPAVDHVEVEHVDLVQRVGRRIQVVPAARGIYLPRLVTGLAGP